MDNSFSPDLITLIDENGIEHNFEILDRIEENDNRYFALMPVYENGADMLSSSGEYTILEAIDVNGEEQLAEIEDDELRRRLSNEFEERFNDMFYD
jgi:uncharacterized protein YrzB (UPF0473 family)